MQGPGERARAAPHHLASEGAWNVSAEVSTAARLNRTRDEVTAGSAAQPVTAKNTSAAYVWYVVVLLCVVNLFNYMDRMALSVLMPAVKADLGLSDSQLGLLTGFAFFVFYALCGIPIAWWADRGVRRDIVAIALAVWSVMTALSGMATNFWHLFAARVGVGIGESGCTPPSQSLISDYVPIKKRPGMFAVHNFGICAGIMVGMALAGWLSQAIGWRWTFAALGLPGILLALVVRFTLREPVRGFFEASDERAVPSSVFATIRMLWQCRTYRMLIACCVATGFIQLGLNQWWPSFYSRVFGLRLDTIGVYLGLAIGIGSAIGLLTGGWLGNKLGRKDLRLPLIIGAFATLLSFPAVLASLFVSSAKISMLFVSLASIGWSMPGGPTVAAAVSVVAPRIRALALSILVFSSAVLGLGLGPFVVGFLSDLFTPSSGLEALRYALLVPALFLPLLALLLYMTGKALPHDVLPTNIDVSDHSPPTRRTS